MERLRAYDLPVRIFHWCFAILFVLSFTISKFIDDDSVLYAYHMLSGILMAVLVVLRIIWGVVGSKTARFSSFPLNPSEILTYLVSIVSSKSKRYLGHNPASSYAALLMMLFTLGIAFSGLMMSVRVYKDFFEEIHELLAHGFLIVVILHLAGVILHQIRHNDNMITSMISGSKDKIEGEDEIESNHPIIALIFVVLIASSGIYLVSNLNGQTRTLSIVGTQLQLGENEEDEHGHKGRFQRSENEHEEEEDDDDYD